MAKMDRRDFLKLVGAGGVGVGAGFLLAESIKHPREHLIPYVVPPEEFSPGIATWYNSVCSMCPAGCGISVRTREGRPKIIQGNPSHPVSQGRLCGLGQAGVHALYNPDRMTDAAAAHRRARHGRLRAGHLGRRAVEARRSSAPAARERSGRSRLPAQRGRARTPRARLRTLHGAARLEAACCTTTSLIPRTLYAANERRVRRAAPAVLRPAERALSAVLRRRLSRLVDLAGASQPRLRPQSTGAAGCARTLRADRAAHVAQRRRGR